MTFSTLRPNVFLPGIDQRLAVLIAAAMILAAVFAVVMTPRLTAIENAASLEDTVPRSFGEWRELPSPLAQVSLTVDGQTTNLDQPYDQVVMRSYRNAKGQVVMLALAWGRRQRQEVKIHRPDLCYASQGFEVKSLQTIMFDKIIAPSGTLTGKRMFAISRGRGEAVSYWMRIGSLYSEDAVDTRLHILKEGIAGRIPDGILVRASMHAQDADEAQKTFPMIEEFLAGVADSVPMKTRTLLIR